MQWLSLLAAVAASSSASGPNSDSTMVMSGSADGLGSDETLLSAADEDSRTSGKIIGSHDVGSLDHVSTSSTGPGLTANGLAALGSADNHMMGRMEAFLHDEAQVTKEQPLAACDAAQMYRWDAAARACLELDSLGQVVHRAIQDCCPVGACEAFKPPFAFDDAGKCRADMGGNGVGDLAPTACCRCEGVPYQWDQVGEHMRCRTDVNKNGTPDQFSADECCVQPRPEAALSPSPVRTTRDSKSKTPEPVPKRTSRTEAHVEVAANGPVSDTVRPQPQVQPPRRAEQVSCETQAFTEGDEPERGKCMSSDDCTEYSKMRNTVFKQRRNVCKGPAYIGNTPWVESVCCIMEPPAGVVYRLPEDRGPSDVHTPLSRGMDVRSLPSTTRPFPHERVAMEMAGERAFHAREREREMMNRAMFPRQFEHPMAPATVFAGHPRPDPLHQRGPLGHPLFPRVPPPPPVDHRGPPLGGHMHPPLDHMGPPLGGHMHPPLDHMGRPLGGHMHPPLDHMGHPLGRPVPPPWLGPPRMGHAVPMRPVPTRGMPHPFDPRRPHGPHLF